MAKRTLKELVRQTKKISEEIENSFTQIILKDKVTTQSTAINIVQLVALIEEIFNRIHHRREGKRVPQRELLQAIEKLGIDSDFLLAFERLKILRNRIVHQVSFCEPVNRYFSRDLSGLNHFCKMKVRMKKIVDIVQEEVYFQGV